MGGDQGRMGGLTFSLCKYFQGGWQGWVTGRLIGRMGGLTAVILPFKYFHGWVGEL